MKHLVFYLLFFPFVGYNQSDIKELIDGILIYSNDEKEMVLKFDKTHKSRFNIIFNKNGILFYPNFTGFCGNEIPKMKEGKWILQDSILIFDVYQLLELKTIYLPIIEIKSEYITFKLE